MKSINFIGELLDKHALSPGFPFHEWASDPDQFQAVRAFFDELFKVASGEIYSHFEDVIEARMSSDFSPYDVALISRQKRVAIYPEYQECGFLLVTNFATCFYTADQARFGEMPDRSWLTIGCDFDAKRLCAVFEIVQTYVQTPFTTLQAEKQMDRNFIKSYGHLFEYPASKRKVRRPAGT